MKILNLLVILSLLAGCSSGQPAYTEMRLPSGKLIKVLGAGRLQFAQNDSALMLRYQCDCTLDDKEAVQKEVDEIWAALRPDVERAKFENAIIAANEPPQGRFITTNRSFNFVFRKSPDGTWKQL